MAAQAKTALTQRRIHAAIAAVTAMLAGIEGEGDWPPDVTVDDLEGALRALQSRRRARRGRS